MHLNYAQREIELKVVYFGPGVGGKTTNVQELHRSVPQDQRTELRQLPTVAERTLFFDWMAIELGVVNGMRLRLKLYTVPGQVFYSGLQMTVLKGVDGVVFVADSTPGRMEANEISLFDLCDLMRRLDRPLTPDFPMVMQYNKRDLPNAIPLPEMESRLNPWGLPAFGASAATNVNVQETLAALARIVAHRVETTPPV